MPSVAFFFDFRSPCSDRANSQLSRLGADVAHRPMDVLEAIAA